MMKKVLIIDDDLETCKQIKYALQDDSTDVYYAASVQDGIAQFISQSFTLVIMDIGLSEINGLTLLNLLHNQNPIPILVLTAHASRDEEINVLTAGADKYLGKPLDIEQCLAHAQAIMRRYMLGMGKQRAYILVAGNGLEINIQSRRAFLHGQALTLTRKQFQMLSVLATHIGEVITKEQIYSEVWSEDYDSYADEALKCQVKKLRQKLGEVGGSGLLETVWGVGYRLNEN